MDRQLSVDISPRPQRLERKAILFVRQSSVHQVL